MKDGARRRTPARSFILAASLSASLGSLGSLGFCGIAFAAVISVPTAATPSDLVTEPTVNLGFSSFYDGFGKSDPGWVLFNYGRWEHLASISDSKGNDVAAFRNPDIEVLASVLQSVWVSPLRVPCGGVGVNALIAVVNLSASFQQPGASLKASGTNIGDLTWGPFFQSKPTTLFQQPFSYRLEFDVLTPVGRFNAQHDLNQGSGFWSINPYVAFTFLPAKGVEITSRIHYLYNFATNRIPNPPFNPNLIARTGQAGQAFFWNYAASQRVSEHLALGLNGYYFQQISNDRLNGINLPHTRKNQVYIGPGLHWEISSTDILNFNVYLPATTHGVANGPQLNYQLIHVF